MYKRFIRWASDRLDDDGIVAFVSNRAFLDSRQDDGFRKVVADEFNELWVIDLKGNARTSGPRRRREGGNIFDDKIRVGVAIYFLIRVQGKTGFTVHYDAVHDHVTSSGKIEFIQKPLNSFDIIRITPDGNTSWLNQSYSDFDELYALAIRGSVRSENSDPDQTIFGMYSNGVKTQRDEWVFDFDRSALSSKVEFFVDTYESKRAILGGGEFDDSELETEIKWDYDLRRLLHRDVSIGFSSDHIARSLH